MGQDPGSLFQRLVERAQDVIWRYRLKPAHQLDYVSPSVVNLLGYTSEELTATPDLVLSLIHPQDRSTLFSVLDGNHAGADSLRLRWLRKDGAVVWVDAQVWLVRDDSGEVEAIEGISRNVTDLVRKDQALALLARDATASTSPRDNDDELILRNTAHLAIPTLADWSILYVPNGAVSTQALSAFGTFVVVHRDQAKADLAHRLQQSLSDGATLPEGFQRAIGEGRSMLLGASDVARTFSSDSEQTQLFYALGCESCVYIPLQVRGRLAGVFLLVVGPGRSRYTSEDMPVAAAIGRRAGLAIENARLDQEAKLAIQIRDDILANVAHDLKSPLGLIKWYTQMLQQQIAQFGDVALADQMSQDLGRILVLVGDISIQIDELVDLARLQSGKPLRLSRRAVDLNALTQEVVDDMQQGRSRHHFEVDADVTPFVGTWDRVRLRRVLINLLSNAIKYSPSGGLIRVSLSSDVRDGLAGARIRILDEGIGIPSADIPHVFKPLFRGSNVDSRTSGTGLGLAICHQIIEQHGGSLAVESEVERGSIFTVWLPLG